MSGSLDGQVTLVTGAGRGIGRAIAEAYGAAGATVVCVARTPSEVTDTANAIEDAGGRALPISLDVSDAGATQSGLAHAVNRVGRIDTAVLNAGTTHERAPIEVADLERWRAVMEVNVFGVLHCARVLIPAMKLQGGGRIVVMGSGARSSTPKGSGGYSASKAALWALVRTMAAELRSDSIAVNEIQPGPVRTAMWTRPTPSGDWLKEPADVAPLALFLAEQPVYGPTGQTFSLRGRVDEFG